MKIWKTSLKDFDKTHILHGRNAVIVFCLLLFAILPFQIGKSDCGIKGPAHYSFVQLDLLAWQSDYAPYLMGYQVINDIYVLQKRDPQYDDNIGEWRGRFCDIPDSTDVEDIVYDATIDELNNLRDAASNRKRDDFYQLHENTFAQVLKENGCKETIDYLIYAKTCEKYCVKGELWGEKPKDAANVFPH